MHNKLVRGFVGAAVMLGALVPGVFAQSRGLDVSYGRWLPGSGAVTYSAAYYRPVLGPLDYGIGITHLQDFTPGDDRSLTGGEVSLGLGRDGRGPYVVTGAGLGFRHVDRNPDAFWSVGGGYGVQLLRVVSLGLEARYRVEDRRTRGFWKLDPLDRRGLILQGRISLSLSSGQRSGPRSDPSSVIERIPRSPNPPLSVAAVASSEEATRIRTDVVETAIAVMGSPYEWGGTDENGFDCSGLIQYAYGEHGVILPRRSRDQARTGVNVDRDVAALVEGDILAFALDGPGISHVGLYVGDGQFIHSSSGGVKLSTLSRSDPEGRYWLEHWSSVSRVVN